MAKEIDPYEVAFKGLKKRGEQARPFQVLVRTEYEVHLTVIEHWEDLLTGEKKMDSTKTKIDSRSISTSNPFLKSRKGPYFLNSISDMIEHFRKER